MTYNYSFETENMGTVTTSVTRCKGDDYVECTMVCDAASVNYYSDKACAHHAAKMIKILEDAGVEFASEDSKKFNKFCIAEIISDEYFSVDAAIKYWAEN